MAYKKWVADEVLNASDLNTAIEHSTPNLLNWGGKLYSDLTSANDIFVVTSSGRYLLEGNSTTWQRFDALRGDAPWPRNATATVAGLTITPGLACRVPDGATDYVLAFAAGGTACYRYAADGTTETAVTFSGTAITTGAYRIGYDPNTGYVYIQDGANKAATAIKRYTFSGSTLTYVDTITLGTAPDNSGSGCMFIGASYLCIDDSASGTTVDIKRYGKNSGTLIDDNTWGGWAASTQHPVNGFVHPNKHYYLITEQVNDNTGNLKAVKWSVDDPST
jgi:hypothetical protein